MEITNRYTVRLNDGTGLVAWGTNDVKLANSKAKIWKGKVVDLSAVGRRLEKHGTPVNYSYRQ